MIPTGDQYRESFRDRRESWIDGQRVEDVTTHPAFRQRVDVRAGTGATQHNPSTSPVMAYHDEAGDAPAVGLKLPHSRDRWAANRAATDAVVDDIGGVVSRAGDDFATPLAVVNDAAGLADRIVGDTPSSTGPPAPAKRSAHR